MIYSVIREIRKLIESELIDYEYFNLSALKHFCGISYHQIQSFEKRGIIDKLPRDQQGEILIPRKMMINTLYLLEAHVLSEYSHKGMICRD